MTTTASVIDLPFDEAIAFFKQKTAIPTKSWRDVWDAAHSKTFMVAGANKQAIVDDFQKAIAKALESGTTLADFQKDFDQIVKTHGWSYKGERGWRTKTIFETNLSTAYAAGRYAQLTAPDTLATFPYWQYNHSGAVHPRVEHLAWNGLVLRADDPFWDTNYPPNGFRCGCFATPVSGPGLRRQGKSGPDTAPNLDQVGTDQPRGVDPSFAYNPGKAWLTQTAPGPVAVSADQAQVAAFVNSSLRGKWPDGSWTPVAIVEKKTAASLKVDASTEIRLTANTIRKLSVAKDATPAAFGTIPRRLAKTGHIVSQSNGAAIIEGKIDGQLWRMQMDIIRESDRASLHVTSLERIGAKP
jgi:hypothetical protein